MTHRRLAIFAVGVAVVATQGVMAIAGDRPVIDIGSRRELFVDDYLIEKLDGGAQLLLHRPGPREVVLVNDKPWEGNACAYFTIFQDGDLCRMYYRGQNYSTNSGKREYRDVACYAESKDGILWTRPELGLFEFEGSKQNNIVWDNGVRVHNFTPFKDTNPGCTPQAKYKALLQWGAGLSAYQSADAIHWSPLTTNAVITQGDFDSQNLAFWDAVRSEYRAYWRVYRPSPGVIGGFRDIKTATSTNFLDWSKPVWLEYPGVRSEQLYTSQVQPYYRAPHLFIGFPTRLLPDRGEQVEGLFMTSRDGRVFHRWEEALIRPGLNKDRWGNRCNYIWLGLVETPSDLPGAGKELSLYTNERYEKPLGPKTRRYTYRLDGFVSVNAPLSGGKVLTKPFMFKGTNLVLNLSTSVAGSVQVEVQDADGRPVSDFSAADCPEIYTDAIDHVVTWKRGADVTRLQGRPIRLLFLLKDADLYAFRFADHP
jgi:hypothetical protein